MPVWGEFSTRRVRAQVLVSAATARTLLISIEHAELLISTPCGLGQLSLLPTFANDE